MTKTRKKIPVKAKKTGKNLILFLFFYFFNSIKLNLEISLGKN